MIRGIANAVPLRNANPLPRIDLDPVWPVVEVSASDDYMEALANLSRLTKAQRIWDLLKAAAEGSNVASAANLPDGL